MKQQTLAQMARASEGASVVGVLILVVLVFGIYSCVSLQEVMSAKSSLTNAVESAIEDSPHHMGDQYLRRKIFKGATAARVGVPEDSITVVTERRPGEHIVNVSIPYEMEVSYLGGMRSFDIGVNVTKVVPVNEKLEAMRLDREQKRRDWEEDVIERRDAQIKEAREECERSHGKGNCVMVLPGSRGF